MEVAEVRGRLFRFDLARLMAIHRRAGEEGAGGAPLPVKSYFRAVIGWGRTVRKGPLVSGYETLYSATETEHRPTSQIHTVQLRDNEKTPQAGEA